MEHSEKYSRKSWDYRRATIAFDSAFKEIELAGQVMQRMKAESLAALGRRSKLSEAAHSECMREIAGLNAAKLAINRDSAH